MSSLPLIFDEMMPTNNYHHHRLLNSHPGNVWVKPTDCTFFRNLNPSGYLGSTLANLDELEKQPKICKDGFQVCLDVQHFQPNEISVKTVDNSVVVEAHHEERKDAYGYISRRFSRQYELPEGYKAKDVVSSISSDGVLIIKCPKSANEGNVRHVQIHHTGPARLNGVNKEEKEKEAVQEVKQAIPLKDK